ncbi:hypothetical protein [Brasilonema sennae]|uniref:hypothetical protein n=1 Tax=Brasilonema sennae TaxID=1397703 RepID=UPI001FEC007C|nr:hypothetical protein [Brasilonema sennae]
MDVNELPLQELFTRLREAGLPLGIDEYQLVLQAMQAGFGMTDKGSLKRLCQTLWIKSAEEKQLFEYQFERVMSSEGVVLTSKKQFKLHWNSRIITRYVILAILAIDIVVGIEFLKQRTPPTQTAQPIQTLQPIQTSKPTQTSKLTTIPQQKPSIQATPTAQPTETPNSNPDPNQTNWIYWSLLIVNTGSVGYILFQQVSQRNSKRRIDSTSHFEATSSKLLAAPLASQLTKTIKDEVQVVQTVLQVGCKNEVIPESRFILTTEYFPVTERQMKQIWRYLRRSVREGAATELDLEATVNQIGRKGLLLEPVLVPRRVNQADLLLLIDQDGSMVPFHALSHRLTETALRGGRLGKAGIYYFHNCPIEYLYHDPNHQQAELVSDVVTHVCSDRTAVLIFSDAGAARGGYSEERYELTKEFLTHLRQRVPYIAWLNPMPKKRWQKTTASEIAHLVPMFELSRRGMQDAISVLRGRPTNFEGRKK